LGVGPGLSLAVALAVAAGVGLEVEDVTKTGVEVGIGVGVGLGVLVDVGAGGTVGPGTDVGVGGRAEAGVGVAFTTAGPSLDVGSVPAVGRQAMAMMATKIRSPRTAAVSRKSRRRGFATSVEARKASRPTIGAHETHRRSTSFEQFAQVKSRHTRQKWALWRRYSSCASS